MKNIEEKLQRYEKLTEELKDYFANVHSISYPIVVHNAFERKYRGEYRVHHVEKHESHIFDYRVFLMWRGRIVAHNCSREELEKILTPSRLQAVDYALGGK